MLDEESEEFIVAMEFCRNAGQAKGLCCKEVEGFCVQL
jgi:hypothetical protein